MVFLIDGLIIIIIPQLLVMGIDALDKVVVIEAYGTFILKIIDWADALTKRDDPTVFEFKVAVEETNGSKFVEKSVQSCEFEVVMVKVFFGVVVATNGIDP